MPEPKHGYGSAAEQGARIRAQMAQKMNANRVQQQQSPSGQQGKGASVQKRRSQRSERNRNSLAELQSVDATGWGQSREEAERARIRRDQERVHRRYQRRVAEEQAAREREEAEARQRRRRAAEKRQAEVAAAVPATERRRPRRRRASRDPAEESISTKRREEPKVATAAAAETSEDDAPAREPSLHEQEAVEQEPSAAEEDEDEDEEREPDIAEEDEEAQEPGEESEVAAESHHRGQDEALGAAAAGGAGLAAAGAGIAHHEKDKDSRAAKPEPEKQEKGGLLATMFGRRQNTDKQDRKGKAKNEEKPAKKDEKPAKTEETLARREEEPQKERKSRFTEVVDGPDDEGYVDDAQTAENHTEPADSEEEQEVSGLAKRHSVKSSRSAARQAVTGAEAGVGAAAGAAAGAGAVAAAETSHHTKALQKGRCFTMDGIDNLALLMEGDSYQTVCFSMYLFKTELDSETLHRFFNKLVEWYPKFHYVAELNPADASKKEKAVKKGKDVPQTSSKEARQGRRTKYSKTLKAGSAFSPAVWRLSDDFKPADNIIEVDGGCPRGKDEIALHAFAGDFLSEHFDYTKPLWSALCVRGLDTSEGAKSALMIKVHHALSDGQGMIMAYHTALAALEQDAPIEVVQKNVDMRTTKGEQKKPGQRNIHPTLWGTTKHGFHTMRGLYFRSRKQFEYGPVHLEDVDEEGRRGNARAAKRFYCHSQGIPMSDIKLVRDAFSDGGLNLSLNDVACAVLTRALRVAAERTETKPIRDKRVAIFVPISKRPAGNWDMANYTTGAIAWFAFYDPKKVPYKDQLAQVNREMNRIKRSHWPHIWFNVFGAFSKRRAVFMPNYPLFRQFFERTYREYHVATNLPGPSKPVKFGEHEAFSYHVLPPSSPGKSSLSIGMISYADDFSLAVSCDGTREFAQRRLAETICSAFQDAAEELVEAAQEERQRMAPRRVGATASDEKEARKAAAAKESSSSRQRIFRRKKDDDAAEKAPPADSPNEKQSEESPASSQ